MLQVYTPTRNLQTQNIATVLVVPRSHKVMFSDRSFAIADHTLWNTLPERIRDSSSISIFKHSW